MHLQKKEKSAADQAMAAATQAAGALGAGMIGMAGMSMMMSDMNFQQSGQAVGNSPPPGTLGGGGSPLDSSIGTLSASLALLPVGLSVVTVFPPFAT